MFFLSESRVMKHPRSLFVALILFVVAFPLALGQYECQDNGNYTANSTYSINLNTLLSSLAPKIDSNGFYHASVGQDIDRANAMVLCRGDLQLNECVDCAEKSVAGLLKSCPNQKQAIWWEEHCTVPYSNATIYGVLAISPEWYRWDIHNATSPDQFKKDLRTLIDSLWGPAANGSSLRKVAAGYITGPDFLNIFALLQCTPDLSRQDCTICLIGAAADIPECCDGRIGGRVLRPSCNLRFWIYPFFNKTRLQELEPKPTPGPTPVPVPMLMPKPVIEPPPQSSPPSGKDDRNSTRNVIIIVVSIGVCLILAVSAIIFFVKKRNDKKPTEYPENEIKTVESLQFEFSTIKAATNDFSDGNKLGQGGFGTVYMGRLPNDQEIAVKRLSGYSSRGDLEFKNEVILLAKLQHRNLVRLLGFALEGMERLLIYEFVQNASLDLFIFDTINRSYLNWDRRYKIITGIARGILYLHEDSRLRIIHRDLKASNVLLDRDMNPKIADFGTARLFGQDETQRHTSQVVGTYGYMSPEYLMHGQFSTKSDVFSFGVLVLEILSGRRNISFPNAKNAEDLLSFAWNNWRARTYKNVVDPMLISGPGASSSMRDVVRCLHIGLLCVQEYAADRPTMASVVVMLSSSSITLELPPEPAFNFPSEHDSRYFNPYNNAFKPDQSDYSSPNDASITDLYPRS